MKKGLIKTTGKIIGGSAIAGIGLSLGRDIYKNTKKNLGELLIILLLFSIIIGLFTASVWLARNYKTLFSTIFIKLGALILVIICGTSLWFVSTFVYMYFSKALELNNQTLILGVDSQNFYVSLPIAVISITGLMTGFIQRKKRCQVWEAEKSNQLFMNKHQLKQYEDGTIEDLTTKQNYRIEHIGKERVNLFALSKRGKRAYIYIDKFGKYSNYTGLVSA